MTIGVIGAMQMEVDDLKAQMTDTQTEVYSGVEFVEGKIGDQVITQWVVVKVVLPEVILDPVMAYMLRA